jgi:poly [ADP-ribose] polymerase
MFIIDQYVNTDYQLYKDLSFTLNQTNIKNNNNKFYIVQVLYKDHVYYVYTRYGRVGDVGRLDYLGCSGEAGAIKEFEKRFKTKTGIQWCNRQTVAPIPNKYTYIEMESVEDDAVKDETDEEIENNDSDLGIKLDDEQVVEVKSKPAKKSKKQVISKLANEVQEFIKMICDIDMMKKQMISDGYDVKKLPIGKVSYETIMKGFDLLKQIENAIQSKNDDLLLDLSSQFFTTIPHSLGRSRNAIKNAIINDGEKLKTKLDMLESLKDIKLAFKIIEPLKDKSVHPIDAKYNNMEIDLKVLDKDSDRWKLINESIVSTHSPIHAHYKLELEQVFEIRKNICEQAFDKWKDNDNRRLLFHGSRMSNWCGILTQGLRIAPPEAPVSGYMFGRSLYFADLSTKSINYCHSNVGDLSVLVLCEVALGISNKLQYSNYHAGNLPKGMSSVEAEGQYVPEKWITMDEGVKIPIGIKDTGTYHSLYHNEYMIYDTSQYRVRYICIVKKI